MAAKELSQKEMKEIKGGLKVDESMVGLKEKQIFQDPALAQKAPVAPVAPVLSPKK